MDNPQFMCPICKGDPIEGHVPYCEVVNMYPVDPEQQATAEPEIRRALERFRASRMGQKTLFMRL